MVQFTLKRLGGAKSRKSKRASDSARHVTQAKSEDVGKLAYVVDDIVSEKKKGKAKSKQMDPVKQSTCVRKTLNWAQSKPYHLFDSVKPDYTKKNGDVTLKKFNLEKLKSEIPTQSPKLQALLDKIKSLDAEDKKRFGKQFKHFIFTDLKESQYGPKIIASGLMSIGIKSSISTKTVPKKGKNKGGNKTIPFYTRPPKGGDDYFAIMNSSPLFGVPFPIGKKDAFDGAMMHMRQDFNGRQDKDGEVNNIHGEYVRFIVLDSGYKEGIDLFDVKYVHLLEPQLTDADEIQAVGRATRKCGQKGLKFVPNKGWKLEVYEYTSSYNGRSLEGLFHKVRGTDLTNIALCESLTAVSIGVAVDRELNVNLNPPYGKLRPGRSSKYSTRVSDALLSWGKENKDIKEFKRQNIDRKLSARIKDFNDAVRRQVIVDINKYGLLKQKNTKKLLGAKKIQQKQRENAKIIRHKNFMASKIGKKIKQILSKKKGGAPRKAVKFDCSKLPKTSTEFISKVGKRYTKTLPFTVKELSEAWKSLKRNGKQNKENPRFLQNLKSKKSAEAKRKYLARIVYHDKAYCKSLEKLATERDSAKLKKDKDGDVIMVDVPVVNLDNADKIVIKANLDQGKKLKYRMDEVVPLLNALLESKQQRIRDLNLKEEEIEKRQQELAKQMRKELLASKAIINKDGNIVLDAKKVKEGLIENIVHGENVNVMVQDNQYHPLEGEDYKTFQKRMNSAFKASPFRWEKQKLINTCSQGYGAFKFSPTQTFLQTYFEPQGVKGMLAWHTVGTGKTCAAVAVKSNTWERQGYTVVYTTRTKLKPDVKKNMIENPICDNIIRDNLKAHRPGYILKLKKQGTSAAKAEIERLEGIEKRGTSEMTPKERNMNSLKKGTNTLEAISFKTLTNVCKAALRLDKGGITHPDKIFASIGKDLFKINCDNKPEKCDPLKKTFIIIDEAHKLFDPTLSSAEKASYDAILAGIRRSYRLSGKDSCRLLLMTATPIVTDPMDYIKLLNLTMTDEEKLPDSLQEFVSKYPLDKNYAFTQQAQNDLQNKLMGRISYLDRGWDATEFSQPHFYQINTEISKDNVGNIQKLLDDCQDDVIHHPDPKVHHEIVQGLEKCQLEKEQNEKAIEDQEDEIDRMNDVLKSIPKAAKDEKAALKDEIKLGKDVIRDYKAKLKTLKKECGDTFLKKKRTVCKKACKKLAKSQATSQVKRLTDKKGCNIDPALF